MHVYLSNYSLLTVDRYTDVYFCYMFTILLQPEVFFVASNNCVLHWHTYLLYLLYNRGILLYNWQFMETGTTPTHFLSPTNLRYSFGLHLLPFVTVFPVINSSESCPRRDSWIHGFDSQSSPPTLSI